MNMELYNFHTATASRASASAQSPLHGESDTPSSRMICRSWNSGACAAPPSSPAVIVMSAASRHVEALTGGPSALLAPHPQRTRSNARVGRTVCCSPWQVCFSVLACTSVLSGTGVYCTCLNICFIPCVSLSVFCSGSHPLPRLVTRVSPPTRAPRRFPLRLPLFLQVHWPSAEHSSQLSQCHP